MTRFLMAGLALVMLAAGSGCVNTCRQCNGGRQGLFANHSRHSGRHADQCRDGLCNRNGGGGGGLLGGGAGGVGGGGAYAGPGGAAVAYPYYTTRAPRDFLDPNPRGIGP